VKKLGVKKNSGKKSREEEAKRGSKEPIKRRRPWKRE